MVRTINTKELREGLPEIVKRVREGERFVVLYRSRPAFRLVPITVENETALPPLEDDPLYHADAVGESSDGFTSRDHDALLYGERV